MTEEQSRWWTGLAGLVAVITVLLLLSIALVRLYTSQHGYQQPPYHWPDTIMRLLFGNSR